ncbi:MAG: SidA/IucD/PvdA family monooxygenase [Frankia sp.]|nr:SidA/IucD/PvdA family monooxygenase [Frankia sp.]
MTPASPAVPRPDHAESTADATTEPFDLVGVGLGPFNLSLAALAAPLPGVRTVFFERENGFHWHPGLLLEGTTIQVPFLADLVTLIDPTSPWSFLSYLRAHDRLFRFYFYERFHIPRREYDDYCRWVARLLPNTRFGSSVEAVVWRADRGLFEVAVADAGEAGAAGPHTRRRVWARNVVLGLGTEPSVPAAFADIPRSRAFHSADYLANRHLLADARHVTVIGSGQSGAEVFLDLLRAQPDTGQELSWITRTPAFAPMEYSKLGLEQFTPDFVRYFHGLPQETKDGLVPGQWQLYRAIDAETIAAIYDLLYERTVGGATVAATLMPNVAVHDALTRDDGRIVLCCRHRDQDRAFTVDTDRVVLATGYTPRRPAVLDPLAAAGQLDLDAHGRLRIDARYRVATEAGITGRIYVQNGELHTHGVGAPDLGLGAWRAAVILDDLTGGHAYPLPAPSAFTTFGVPPAAADIPDGRADAAPPDAPPTRGVPANGGPATNRGTATSSGPATNGGTATNGGPATNGSTATSGSPAVAASPATAGPTAPDTPPTTSAPPAARRRVAAVAAGVPVGPAAGAAL